MLSGGGAQLTLPGRHDILGRSPPGPAHVSHCNHVFATEDVRLFGGRLSLNGYRVVAVALLVVCVLLVIYLPPR